MDAIIELVKQLRRKHYVADDCWYSCPFAVNEYGDSAYCGNYPDRCDCGVDEHNKIVDEVLVRLVEFWQDYVYFAEIEEKYQSGDKRD